MLVPDDTVPGGIRAVVMDFGLGKAIQPDPELVRLTQTGIILGTPEFMSPEQVRGEKIDGGATSSRWASWRSSCSPGSCPSPDARRRSR